MSEVKVNKISPRTNCGTVQLGDSGDTITIPAGATITNNGTQTGFGRTGAVDWQTTVKTSGFTAVSGEGYFCNTTSGAFTVTLPASPSAGDIVSISDYAQTFDTNNLTLGRNGSNIAGAALDSLMTTEGIAVTLVYADATKGWIVTESGLQSEAPGPQFVAATGGNTVATCGDFKIHTFTSPGTFCVSAAGNAAGSNTVSYMVIAGGGGGGPSGPGKGGGGGGAGGFREGLGLNDSYTGSPLRAPTGVPVTATGFPITVGGGGALRVVGSNSVFSTITSAGGGSNPGNCAAGTDGGSGGGAGKGTHSGGAGNTPPVSPPQGNPGGDNPGNPGETSPVVGTGGGGAGNAGSGVNSNTRGGRGGVGVASSITGSSVKYAGGGGGGGSDPGGGGGINPPSAAGCVPGNCRTAQFGAGSGGITAGGQGGNGTANTGGGAGGGGNNGDAGGAGGSGIVVIRYKFQ